MDGKGKEFDKHPVATNQRRRDARRLTRPNGISTKRIAEAALKKEKKNTSHKHTPTHEQADVTEIYIYPIYNHN